MSHLRKGQPTQFVRGGQTTQHWWRMAAQVVRTSLFVALAAFTLTYTALVLANYELRYMRETFASWTAHYNVRLGGRRRSFFTSITSTDGSSGRQDRSRLTIG
ncbi:hypothetical protein APX01_21720 (plasmid) [Cereibacter sphaeroides]|uniref:hypothetical protein n=1 Tax=Cereibacter sphaeroides TaxID=1063 RepID=UPI00076F6E4A|nr:hypothetical protein [Cereibacter sphaeroides]AMJ50170.1 hypothetical protein APX01_21720 [Cereibacter sphaeroides]